MFQVVTSLAAPDPPVHSESLRETLRMAAGMFRRPQPVTVAMVVLFAIIPFYLVIGVVVAGGPVNVPELALDAAVPLQPFWSVIYGSLFLAALLPGFVVHQQKLLQRAILAYLALWLVSFICFLAYPTAAPLHAKVAGNGFFEWALLAIYGSDVHYNCFPSLHVAQCFLAAFVCYRVNRGVGVVTGVWAFFVGLSTLYTKQHYILDVIAGALLAYAAYLVFLRSYPRDAIPELDRRVAPVLAAGAFAAYGLMLVGFLFLYLYGG